MSFTSNNDSNLPAPGTGVEIIATTSSSKEEDQLDLDIDTEVPFTFGDDSSNQAQAQATYCFGIAPGSGSCIKIILGVGVTAATLAFFGTTMKVANHNDVISTNSAAAFDSVSIKVIQIASCQVSKSSKSKSSTSKSGDGGGGGGGGGGCGSGACSPEPLNFNCLYDLVGPGYCEDSAGTSFAYITFSTTSECECAQVRNECVNGKVNEGEASFMGFYTYTYTYSNGFGCDCFHSDTVSSWNASEAEACKQQFARSDDTGRTTVGPITNSSGKAKLTATESLGEDRYPNLLAKALETRTRIC